MKKIILILLFLSQNLISQNKHQLFVFEEIQNELISTKLLYINLNKSLWLQNSDTKIIESKKDESVMYKPSKNKSKYILFKNLKKSEIYHNYKLLSKVFYVKDSLSNMKWNLIDSTEVVLGYNCQIAKTKFRGREYFASFTSEIAIQNGPWKFHGLPGMILKVVSDENDEFYKMECIEIKLHNENIESRYQKFIEKNKFITWEQLEKTFLRIMDNVIKKLKTSYETSDAGESTVTIKVKNRKEIISEKFQLKEGVTTDF
ncbi:MAG: GLPGLI family protein [Bacteroidetes bacterium]|nr:GLPGLI family protein [Bacteroidota bacterium]